MTASLRLPAFSEARSVLAVSGAKPRNLDSRSSGMDSSRITTTSPCSATRTICSLRRGTVSITESSGSTSVRSPTRTSNPSRMAKVSGNSIETVEPIPRSLSKATVPCNCWTLRLTTSIPTPRPERSLIFSQVENPGSKINIRSCSSSNSESGPMRPRWMALMRTFSVSMPAPSSDISITIRPER